MSNFNVDMMGKEMYLVVPNYLFPGIVDNFAAYKKDNLDLDKFFINSGIIRCTIRRIDIERICYVYTLGLDIPTKDGEYKRYILRMVIEQRDNKDINFFDSLDDAKLFKELAD